jgi:hypothetical protein
MSLNYTEVRHQLESVKTQIDNLLEYMELNQSEANREFIDLEIYVKLADISTNVLKSESMEERS